MWVGQEVVRLIQCNKWEELGTGHEWLLYGAQEAVGGT